MASNAEVLTEQQQPASPAPLVPAPPSQPTTLYHNPESERFATEQRMAKLFVTSGLFADIKGQTQEQAIAQAYVKIALGHAMGFSPAESMQGIDIIQGRPAVGSQLRAVRMQRAGFSWIPTVTDRGCWLVMFQNGKPIMGPRIAEDGTPVRDAGGAVAMEQVVISFTEKDAKSANLLGKDNWKKDPSSMYFARAITRAQRRCAPGVLSADVMSVEEAIDAGTIDIPNVSPIQEPRRITQADVEKVVAERAVETVATAEPGPAPVPYETVEAMRSTFRVLKQAIGEAEFSRILSEFGVTAGDLKLDERTADVWRAMNAAVQKIAGEWR